MKYKYVGDGPFPQYVYSHNLVINEKEQTVDVSEPINHPHFVEIQQKSKGEK